MTTTKWALDPTHSEIGFKVKHMMFTNISGSFNNFEVTAETGSDDFTDAKIEFKANVNSVSTNNEQRDTHLKSADFFDAENFPAITFSATEIKLNSLDDYKLTGNLTIKGITKSISLDLENGGLMKDPWGNLKAGFSILGSINRTDFGLVWNAPLETGGVLVSDEVRINCEIQLVKQA
jgi:polyisoprenoid-binding protein YceI